MRHFLIVVLLFFTEGVIFAQPGRIYTSIQEVEDPSQVYHLRLHHKRLRQIPPEVFTFSNLQELDLRGNRIDTLPEEIGKLLHLQKLDLSRNRLRGLPSSIGKLTELKELILWSTWITALPEEISALDSSLETLDLRDGMLTADEQDAIRALLPSVKILWDLACNCSRN